MADSKIKAAAFHALHVPGKPLVLFNVWDAGSAKIADTAGARAIATSSWSVAAANGYADGEEVPFDFAMANLARIVGATELPVTVDVESGYGKTVDAVGQTIARTIEAGASGCNLEDSYPENGELRGIAEQTERIQRARAAADSSGIPYFINARTDVFFQTSAEEHDEAMLQDAIERAKAYADAGANGLFVPGLIDSSLITRLVEATSLPLNVMVSDGLPRMDLLARAGVARVSHGARPYMALMKSFEDAARAAFAA